MSFIEDVVGVANDVSLSMCKSANIVDVDVHSITVHHVQYHHIKPICETHFDLQKVTFSFFMQNRKRYVQAQNPVNDMKK